MNQGTDVRRMGRALLVAALLPLAGCATGPHANPRDPFEPFNRGVSEFNENVDAVILKPSATFYREKVPPLVRTGVSNFFNNLGDAWSAVNSALQLKLGNAAENWMRFSFNTVFGFAGVLDIASEMNIERHREDFGQTLGQWGMPAGPYIVLPLLGPSTLRDTVALPVDWQGDPLAHFKPEVTRDGLYVLRVVDVRSNLLRASDVLEGAALDRYSFLRDSYLQRRRAEIGPPRVGKDDGSDGQEPELESGAAQPPGGAPAGAVPPAPVAPAPSR
jgi:phospholipid-binding lipoprotein MlaA